MQKIDEENITHKTLMPTGSEMKKLLRVLDLTYSMQLLLSQFQSLLIWTGITEAFLQIGLFCAFCAAPSGLAGIWLMIIFHLPRALLGLFIVYKSPKSHEIIDQLDLTGIQEHELSVEKMIEHSKFSFSVLAVNKSEQYKLWLLIYSGATLICYIFDCICFIVAYQEIIAAANPHTGLLLLLSSTMNLILDVFYLVWIVGVARKLPYPIGSYLQNAILGYSKKMKQGIVSDLKATQRPAFQAALEKNLKEQQSIKAEAAKQSLALQKEKKLQVKK